MGRSEQNNWFKETEGQARMRRLFWISNTVSTISRVDVWDGSTCSYLAERTTYSMAFPHHISAETLS